MYELVDAHETADPHAARRVDLFVHALELYGARAFAAAANLFDAYLTSVPHDVAAAYYRTSCNALAARPPPANWDPTIYMTRK